MSGTPITPTVPHEGHANLQHHSGYTPKASKGRRGQAPHAISGGMGAYSEDIGEGNTLEVRPQKRRTDPAKWKVKIADEGEHARRTFLRVIGQTNVGQTQQEKTIRGKAFIRHHTDGSAEDRRRMPYRVEWDDSDESDEESDLIIDPEDEHYHIITTDEEQGEGPVPDEPLGSATSRDCIINRGDLHAHRNGGG
eukprot:1184460-Prorocentrum_minimum.AAC.2